MSNKTINTSLTYKFSTLLVLSFCFFAFESLAQEEQEKVRVEIPLETVDTEDLNLEKEISPNPNLKAEPSRIFSVPAAVANQNKLTAEPLGENRKIKKEESSSTLSFNLFLYIVDKFRAD